MIRVFDFRHWWTIKHHDQDQMDMLGYIHFTPVAGYPHLFVANVAEADEIMLKLLGIPRDPTIYTSDDTTPADQMTRMLYKNDDYYVVIEVTGATLSNNK